MLAIGAVAVVAMLLVAGLVLMSPAGPGANNNNQGTIPNQNVVLQTTSPTTAASGTASQTGSTIQVNNPASPMNGLEIVFPQGAASEDVDVTVQYSDITSAAGLPEGASVASKLITINTEGSASWNQYREFDQLVSVTLPFNADVDPQASPVFFYTYDPEDNTIDSMGFLNMDESSNTQTFATTTFSTFFAVVLDMTYAEMMGGSYSVDSGFRPATDGWRITNYGSMLNEGGNCIGMVVYAQWYYKYGKSESGGLYNNYIQGDPNDWKDDATAIELASRAQKFVERQGGDFWDKFTSIEEEAGNNRSAAVAASIVHSLVVTGEPQLVTIRVRLANGNFAAGGHAIMAYSYGEGRFEIYDPNFPGTSPGDAVRRIPFTMAQGFTSVYHSGQSAGASSRQYNIFYHAAAKSVASKESYQALYDMAKKNFEDSSLFPEIKFTDSTTTPEGTTPIDTNSDGIRDTSQGNAVISGTVSVLYVTEDKSSWSRYPKIWMFVNDDRFLVDIAWDSEDIGSFSKKVPLDPEENEIVLLFAKTPSGSGWGAYARTIINSELRKSSLTITLTWDTGKSDVDLHVLEPTIDSNPGRHIYYSNKGSSGSGNPYLDFDDTSGYGPEHYIATEGSTLPNYQGEGVSLYGEYKIRIHYFADHDDDYENDQYIGWQVTVTYLAYHDQATGIDVWESAYFSGGLGTPTGFGGATSDFYSSSGGWSSIYTFNYPVPVPSQYTVSPAGLGYA
ncbi:MAG: hypothetical protein QCI38_03670 [Candidatus Thermoplasmatota archaeon]|nr:hypothetical protein [Candidatus Thermoplasmatota archaeon]